METNNNAEIQSVIHEEFKSSTGAVTTTYVKFKENVKIPTVTPEDFEIEKYAKNQAYYFILTAGLLPEFSEFLKNYHSDDPHADCVNFINAIQMLRPNT